MLEKLLPPLKDLVLPAVDRLGVQGDVFALAKAGFLPTSQALDIALSLRNEVDYTVWAALAGNIASLLSVFIHEPFYPRLETFARHLYEDIGQKLGWEVQPAESPSATLLRGLVLARLGVLKHQPTVEEARNRFQKYLNDRSTLIADLRSPVLEIVLANGGETEYDQVIDLYRKAQSAEEKSMILAILAQQPSEHLTRKALQFTLSGEVRDQDLFSIYYKLGGLQHGARVGWQFVQDNWEGYYSRLSKGAMILTRIIGRATDSFTTPDKAQEIEAFFRDHPYAPAERTVKQSIETIRMRAGWLNSSRQDVEAWLLHNKF